MVHPQDDELRGLVAHLAIAEAELKLAKSIAGTHEIVGLLAGRSLADLVEASRRVGEVLARVQAMLIEGNRGQADGD